MPYWDWDESPKPRLKAKNGIKAKSTRGDIGQKWWSQRFVKALEAIIDHNRLGRGRNYARSGQVMDLVIKPGKVTAKVQGSSYRPYNVTIELRPFEDDEWQALEKSLTEQALFAAKLLAGEMPQEIEDAFRKCRLSLFPDSRRSMDTDCSCPDSANPCKHIAATFYILAEQFDEDPFLIFLWRGRSKDKLIANLRLQRGQFKTEREPATTPEINSITINEAPLSQCLNDFWQLRNDMAQLHFQPQASKVSDALLRQLGRAPIDIAGQNLAEALQPIYQAMAQAAEHKALGKEED